jgi:hypothetical protein
VLRLRSSPVGRSPRTRFSPVTEVYKVTRISLKTYDGGTRFRLEGERQ